MHYTSVLQGVPEPEVRRQLVEALGDLYRGNGPQHLKRKQPLPDLCERVLVLAQLCPANEAANVGYRIYDSQRDPSEPEATRKILTAAWALVAQGLVFPHITGQGVVHALTLTDTGIENLCNDDPGPRHPRFVEALKVRCPKADDDDELREVLARVEDAAACLMAGVPRAAAVMAGLAWEVTMARALDALVTEGHVQRPQSDKAQPTLDGVRRGVEGLSKSTPEDRAVRHRLRQAVSHAEAVRDERNRAAHEAASNFDQRDVEEMVRSTAYHLPAVWTELVI